MKKSLPALLIGLAVGALGTWLLLSHGLRTPPEAEPPAGLKTVINPDTATIVKQIAAVGLTTAQPTTAQLTPEAKAYGRVLDPTPLVALVAEISAAESALTASTKEYERTKSLYDKDQNASLQAVEAANAAMLRDRTALASAQSRLTAGWGSALAKRNGLSELVQALAGGDTAIVRIDLPSADTAADNPKSVRVSAVTGDPDWHEVELLGPASSTDSQLGGQSYLALWRGASLRPGAALRAMITGSGAPQKVVVVPNNSIVRYNGGNFVYVPSGEHGFERRLVTLGPAVAGGTAVTDGVTESDKIVVTGAAQLLSTEIMGSSAPEE